MTNIQKRTTGVQSPGSLASKTAPIDATGELVSTPVDPIVSKTGATNADIPAAVAEGLVKLIPATETTSTKGPQGMNAMMKNTGDFIAFGQANMEAFVKSGQTWTAGIEALMKQYAETAKASFDQSIATFQAIASATSIAEAMELQGKFATSAAKGALAQSNKLVDASIKLAEQTLAPLTARLTGAAEKFGSSA